MPDEPSAAAMRAAEAIHSYLWDCDGDEEWWEVANIIDREMRPPACSMCAELAAALRHVGILIENIVFGGDAWKDAIHRVKDRLDAALTKYEEQNDAGRPPETQPR